MKAKKPQAICIVLTSPFVLNAFLLNHLRALADVYKVTVCINTQESSVSPLLDKRIELIHAPIAREINLSKDSYALAMLVKLFWYRRFDAVHTVTPKAGLLGMLAAWLTRVPHRTHTFTGQVWANRHGFARGLLKCMDRVLVYCATSLLADSKSQAAFLADEGVCRHGEVQVLGGGSISGVDLNRFASRPERRERLRAELNIPSDALVFVYLGRLHPEKGVEVLAHAFARLEQDAQTAWIIFVGPDEGGLAGKLLKICGTRGVAVGLTDKPEDYLNIADVLCLPSYREGFGTVVIEAAAIGVPAIGSNIYGLSDAIVNESTGVLVSAGDVDALHSAMYQMFNLDFRRRLASSAQQRAHAEFSAEKITASWCAYYASVFDEENQKGRT